MRYSSFGILFLIGIVIAHRAYAQSCLGTPMATVSPPDYSSDGAPSQPPAPPPPAYNPGSADPGTGGPGTSFPPGDGTVGIAVPPGASTPVNPWSARPGTCVAGTSPSDVGNFSRQTSGYVSYSGNRFALKGYNGDMTSLAAVAQGNWPTYQSGYSITPNINSGCYIALEFTPTSSGSIQFTSDPSYGEAGLISLSTEPGEFSSKSSNVICSMARGASNNLYVTTPDLPSQCHVQIGQTYYINFQNSDLNGIEQCDGQSAYPCAASQVSYSLVTSGH